MFKTIASGIQKKGTALREGAQFSRFVERIVKTVFPRLRTLRIVRARTDTRTRGITLTVRHDHHVSQLNDERGLIKAALRNEGVDVRIIRIERADAS